MSKNKQANKLLHLFLLATFLACFGTAKASQTKEKLYEENVYPQAYCLALNMYYETRGSNLADMAAVSDVVLNRVQDARYPNTICEVIYDAIMKERWETKQHKDLPDSERKYIPVRNQCQFSWYCDGKPDEPRNIALFNKSLELAYYMTKMKKYRGISEGATHYHATYVSPGWRKDFTRIGRIGSHIFYRWD